MDEKELIERDSKRDLGAELLESVRQMKAGQKGAVHQVEVSENGEINIRLSPEVLEYFRKEGGNWQSKIDDALKTYIFEHPNTVREGQKRLKHRISAVEKITAMFLEDLYSDAYPFWN